MVMCILEKEIDTLRKVNNKYNFYAAISKSV